MPHKCTKCGREYRDGSTEILKGCASCGNKKFLYVKEEQLNKDVLEEKSIGEIVEESKEVVLEVIEPKAKMKKEIEMYDRVETIRIVSPGTYELNLEKMAQSDERIVSVGKEGSYIIDLMSMAKDEPKKKKKQPAAGYQYPGRPAGVSDDELWIDVDLSSQRSNVYVGDTLMREFLVSTGTWLHPTVTGTFKIYVRYRYADMSGPGYYLPDVPYVMYFYKDYGLHGTYWHHNFGTPMSHGCVNFPTVDAGWIFENSRVGTIVNVHQ